MIVQNKKGYALALLELAKEEEKLNQYFLEIKELKKIFENNKEFISLIESKEIKLLDKFELIDKIFEGKMLLNIINFMKVLIERNDFFSINKILNYFLKICSEALGIAFGFVYSTQELNKKTINQLEVFYSKKLDKKIELKNLIDKSLIRGIKIEILNEVYENSINNNIRELKKVILEKEQ